jgi:DNA-binding transcriptional LysR family regulator
MDLPGIAGLNLSQLRVLDALYEERSVQAAAARLFITPSAVSHALRKLRGVIGDELFLRRPDGMQPTARAHEIAPGLREALGLLQNALNVGAFDPARSTRKFRIACLLSLRITLGPGVARLLSALEAAIRVEFQQIGDTFVEDLESGRIDLAISSVGKTPPWMRSALVLEEAMAFAIRKGHPRGEAPLTLAELAQLQHVDLHTTDFRAKWLGPTLTNKGTEYTILPMDRATMTSALEEAGLAVDVPVTVPDTVSALSIVAATDMTVLCPRRVAQIYADRGEIVLLDLPYSSQPTAMRMIWNVRQDRDPAHLWLRKTIMDITAPLRTAPRG